MVNELIDFERPNEVDYKKMCVTRNIMPAVIRSLLSKCDLTIRSTIVLCEKLRNLDVSSSHVVSGLEEAAQKLSVVTCSLANFSRQ